MNLAIDWNLLFDHLLTLVFSAATPVVLYLIHKLISKIADKYHLENLVSYNNVVDGVVTNAIQAIEAEAAHMLQNNNTVLTAEQKLNSVIKWIQDEIDHLGISQPPPAQVAMRVHSVMFKTKKVS